MRRNLPAFFSLPVFLIAAFAPRLPGLAVPTRAWLSLGLLAVATLLALSGLALARRPQLRAGRAFAWLTLAAVAATALRYAWAASG